MDLSPLRIKKLLSCLLFCTFTDFDVCRIVLFLSF